MAKISIEPNTIEATPIFFLSPEMYIDNSWLHICLLNRQCKREKWVKQEGRDSFCSAVGSTRIWPWFYLKFDDIWLPDWYKFYRMLCAMPMPINRWNQLLIIAKNRQVKVWWRTLWLASVRQWRRHLFHKLWGAACFIFNGAKLIKSMNTIGMRRDKFLMQRILRICMEMIIIIFKQWIQLLRRILIEWDNLCCLHVVHSKEC